VHLIDAVGLCPAAPVSVSTPIALQFPGDESIAEGAMDEEKGATDGCLAAGRKLTGKVNEAEESEGFWRTFLCESVVREIRMLRLMRGRVMSLLYSTRDRGQQGTARLLQKSCTVKSMD
jgi:hypothetical protein